MRYEKQTVDPLPLSSLKAALKAGVLDDLHKYIDPDSHLNICAFWTQTEESNDTSSSNSACQAVAEVLKKIDGEPSFATVGAAFIQRILLEHTKAISRNLSSLKPQYVHPTLEMLVKMSEFDVGAVANDVYSSLDFRSSQVLPKLLKAYYPQVTKVAEDEKVKLGKRKREFETSHTRELFLKLLFNLLSYASSTSKGEILQSHHLTTELFKHLVKDPEESLRATLNSFKAILDSEEVPRPAKIQFFNEWALSQLISLYTGPDPSDDAAPSIRQALQEFFLEISTVPGKGICFPSDGLVPPSSKRLYNPILSKFLAALKLKPFHGCMRLYWMQCDLILSIMKVNPELIAPWLQNTSLDIAPRLEDEWIYAMSLIESILEIPLPKNSQLSSSSIPDDVLLENILPTVLYKILPKALQHESDEVKLMTCRTLHISMEKLSTLPREDDKSAHIFGMVQRRLPLLEVLLPTANSQLNRDSPEASRLLRQTIIDILAAYIDNFENVPNFDFVKLFNSIMTASLFQSEDTGQQIDGPSQIPVATAHEKETILHMTEKIDGVQWLSQKKGSKSILRIILQHIRNVNDQASETKSQAISVLHHILSDDSFMFSPEVKIGDMTYPSPVPKVEAVIRALDEYEDSTEWNAIIDFIEKSMVNFQAAPYKYWDLLVELLPDEGKGQIPAFSPLLLALHEQLFFIGDQSHIRQWFSGVMTLLMSIGEDERIAEDLVHEELVQQSFLTERTLWSSATSLTRLAREAREGSALGPIWQEVRAQLRALGPADLNTAKIYANRIWTHYKVHDEDSFMGEALLTMCEFWTREDFAQDNQCHLLLIKILAAATLNELPFLGSMVSPQNAQSALDMMLQIENRPIRPPVIAALIECLDSEAKLRCSQIEKLASRFSIREKSVLVATTRAMNRSAVEPGDLLTHIGISGLVDSAGQELCDSEIAQFMVASLNLNRMSLPVQWIPWVAQCEFVAKCYIISYLLDNSQEGNFEIAEELLASSHFDATQSIVQLDDTIAKCLIAKAKVDPRVSGVAIVHEILRLVANDQQAHYGNEVEKQAIQPIRTDHLELLASMAALVSGESLSDTNSIISFLHHQINRYLTIRFSWDCAKEGKSLSESVLKFVTVLRQYVTARPTFIDDVGVDPLKTLISAAIDHQLHWPQVLQLLKVIVQKSTAMSVDYSKVIQSILANPSLRGTIIIPIDLAQLLQALFHASPSISDINIFQSILKFYTGTVSTVDLYLYEILSTLESAIGTAIPDPFTSWRLVEVNADILRNKRSLDFVLSSELALQTILSFKEHDKFADMPNDDYNDTDRTYDLRYINRAILAWLRETDSSSVRIEQLITHHALGLAFLGLSSQHREVRSSSWALLREFVEQISSSKISARDQLLTLLEAVNRAINCSLMESGPIPRLQAVFFALATDVLMDPCHVIYSLVNTFILRSDTIDLDDVPLFFELFYCSSDHSKHMQWLLRMLTAGICEPAEKAYSRRHVLELFMGLFRSKSTSLRIREAIALLLETSFGVQSMRHYFERVGGLAWLSMGTEPELDSTKALLSQDSKTQA